MLEASEEPQADLAWLALASMAVFISGEILEFSQTIYYWKLAIVLDWTAPIKMIIPKGVAK